MENDIALARENLPNHQTQGIDVSIVMPCLNEVRTLETCIDKAKTAIAQLNLQGEIVIADNGSTDGSVALAERLGARVVPVTKKGYGAALIAGMKAAKGHYLVMGDADDSYDFREAVPMVEKLQHGYDLVMGSRLRGTILPGAMPWKNRYIGTPVLTKILNWVYGCKFSDVNCGLRAISKPAFTSLTMESRGMEFASEMLVKAAILGLKSTEVPITLHPDGRDRPPHLQPWADGWRHLKYILLFAPKVLYWIPGILLFLCGSILAIALNTAPGGTYVYLAGIGFNDHWIVVAALLCIIGYEILVMGLLAYLYTLTHRVTRRSAKMDKLLRWLTMERIILISLALLAIGLAWELSVIKAWVSGNFGPLNAFRPAVTGMTLLVMGVHTLFSSFFYAVLSDRYKNKYE
ncbi:glycosyltransferase family 2 protein [Geitlerinema sp. PCC 9228]|uniref:glycosyltransferase family 2 protein n=1 Tax=Geitlerinema sp. PCC 9228 TaxID=111611 RepID=UPI0009FD8F18|nr:glycosyltransferase family 2 protein [Geitlerinema sp. PCC 9228]